jgi:hypothetical protein
MGIYTRRDGPPSNGRGAVKLNQNIASALNIFRDIANPFLHSTKLLKSIYLPLGKDSKQHTKELERERE